VLQCQCPSCRCTWISLGQRLELSRRQTLLEAAADVPYAVQVAYGCPLPPTTEAGEVRRAMQKLSADARLPTPEASCAVHRRFVRMAPGTRYACLVDTTERERHSNYGKVLAGAVLLSRRLRPMLEMGRRMPSVPPSMVGIWLPPSVGGALANIALALLGKTALI